MHRLNYNHLACHTMASFFYFLISGYISRNDNLGLARETYLDKKVAEERN